MEQQQNWYTVSNSAEIDSPALLLYPDRVVSNINKLVAMVSSPSLLRPHVKTHKSVDVSKLMLAAGITKFKCATIAEAEMLGKAGAEDVLLAYQPNNTKLARFIHLITAYPQTKYACLVDNEVSAKMISDTAIENNIVIPVCIDLNVGMNRTGIDPDRSLALFTYLNTLPGLWVKGLHAYDGHIEEVDLDERASHCARAFAPVEKLRNDIQALGHSFPLLIAGGSPTFALHAKRPYTECSPGTFVFWDKNYYDHIPDQRFLFAAVVLTRVVSLPNATSICIDLGYKAVACEKPVQNRAYFLNAPQLIPASHSEEHLVIEVPQGHHYHVGDELYALPVHVCPTVAMYNQAHIIENGQYTRKWEITARGRELSV